MTTQAKVKLRPLADRVLVKRSKNEERTTGGIILPDTAREKQELGEVIAVGSGKMDKDGKRLEIPVKVGDKVMWDKFAGNDVKIEDEEDFVIVKADDIIAIVE
ncbi:MAG: co-chaperone GroES [Chlamydiae bacterium]|jgi:chaperonin GroES|nr:co-chaperone GroES [Chlamydiota bacterium]